MSERLFDTGAYTRIAVASEQKLCECGCGEPAPIAAITKKAKGHIKGQPVRFISGHNRRGARQPSHGAEARRKIGIARAAQLSPEAGEDALHVWLLRHCPKTGVCVRCGAVVGTAPPNGTHHAYLHHPKPYTRNRDDYAELCVPCHRRMDAAQRKKQVGR